MKKILFLIITLSLVYCESSVLDMTKFGQSDSSVLTRARRDTGDCPASSSDKSILKTHTDIHVFANDSNPAISIIWSGNKGTLLALTTMSSGIFPSASKLYRSTNYGKSFTEISSLINHAIVSKQHGMLVSPVDSNYVLLIDSSSLYSMSHGHERNTVIHVTTDSGVSFDRVECPFNMNPGSVTFNARNHLSIAALSAFTHELWVSHDFGLKWRQVDGQVLQVRWDPVEDEFLYYTKDPTKRMLEIGFNNELYRVSTSSTSFSPVKIAEHVYSFGIQGGYIFISIEYLNHNGSRVMHVSKDKGTSWDAAQIPLIGPQQFYSLLDMSEDMVFVHVDLPGNDGDGVIYTSDERGIIYSKSLEHHLYPALGSVTDFYKVESLTGVYITSQSEPSSQTIHSSITFDKGGLWRKIDPPRGSKCEKTEKECYLQIHSLFSQSKGVTVPEFPKSTASAPGIIIAHGNIGDALNFLTPDVYVSSDGGYSWMQPAELKGPHFYGIGDSGGILYAVQAFKPTNILKFSLDEGQCWQEYQFTNSTILVTGVSIEPGSHTTILGLWGWDKNGDGAWRSVTVDFNMFLKKTCGKDDYVTWRAHESNDLAADACLLGSQVVFKKRKKGHICVNGKDFTNEAVLNPCLCVKTDFLCDYGFVRTVKGDCIEDKEFLEAHLDICVDGTDNMIQTKGYRKIPGDKCEGGFDPVTQLISHHKSCLKTETSKDNFGTNSDDFSAYVPPGDASGKPNVGLTVILVLAIIALICILLYVFNRRKGIRMKLKYSRLPSEPLTSSLSNAESGPDSPDTILIGNGKSTSSISYHDDSDEDLLVT